MELFDWVPCALRNAHCYHALDNVEVVVRHGKYIALAALLGDEAAVTKRIFRASQCCFCGRVLRQGLLGPLPFNLEQWTPVTIATHTARSVLG